MFGDGFSEADVVNYTQTVADKVTEDEAVMQEISVNSAEQVMLGNFPEAVKDAVLESGQKQQNMMLRVLGDEATAEKFTQLILQIITKEIAKQKKGLRP